VVDTQPVEGEDTTTEMQHFRGVPSIPALSRVKGMLFINARVSCSQEMQQLYCLKSEVTPPSLPSQIPSDKMKGLAQSSNGRV